jgi:hypothetical protein
VSWRTALMDVQMAYRYLQDRVDKGLVGDRGAEVEAALEVLVKQIKAAELAVETTEVRAQLDHANHVRAEAEKRLDEIAAGVGLP